MSAAIQLEFASATTAVPSRSTSIAAWFAAEARPAAAAAVAVHHHHLGAAAAAHG